MNQDQSIALQIKQLLRDSIDFSLAEKQRIISELGSKSLKEQQDFLDILHQSAGRYTALALQYPERAKKKREQSRQEWDGLFGA